MRRTLGYLVHVYTASGAVCAVLGAQAITRNEHAAALFWMIVATAIDGSDGFLARRFKVTSHVPEIDGRKLDDLVDFVNYSFLPLFLVANAGWLPKPAWLWAGVGLVASLLAFSNVDAKKDGAGFFVGFPSYWNVFAFYTVVWLHGYGGSVVLALLLVLSVLSVSDLHFVYPTRARRWKWFFLGGSWIWLLILLLLLREFGRRAAVSPVLLGLSLLYPVLYLVLSLYLDVRRRRKMDHSAPRRP